ncbi:MAG: hypothetical protein ACUVXH_04085 [Anaerolineae bacterium]
MRKSFPLWPLFLALLLGAAACHPSLPPTPIPEPLVPTPLPDAPTPEPAAVPFPDRPPRGRERFGVGVPVGRITDYPVERLGVGWYLTWRVEVDPPRPGGMAFWQVVRVSEEGYRPDALTIRAAARANPGAVWLLGNEPDVAWQDNVTPERYAEQYHDLYTLLEEADPAAVVAIAGVSQPTPLRLAYLERVLAAYRERYGVPMPVDLWNVHGFVLREERDSWGVGIPPGLEWDAGLLHEVQDHDDLGAFQEGIWRFRRWMARQGEREKPLAVTEYGVLMPASYGFDAARVQRFLYGTWDFFLTAADPEVGYPPDENRLVQWWCWYSLADTVYPTGNLADPRTKALTPLGAVWAAYRPPEER